MDRRPPHKAHRAEIGHGADAGDRRGDAPPKRDDEALHYFKAVETALVAIAAQQREREALGDVKPAVGDGEQGAEDQAAAHEAAHAPAEEAIGPAAVLDGFCTELAKRMNNDAKALLGNKAVCRTIELALSASERRHVRAIAYTFLGRAPMMATSPTASFVLETLFAALYRALGTAQDAGAEPDEDEQRGMPPLPELLRLFANELRDAMATLLWDRGGAKCVAGALLVAAGFPIRSVPAHDNFRSFALVDDLGATVRAQLDLGAGKDHSDTFRIACTHVSATFVIQAMLRAAASQASHGHQNQELGSFLRERMGPLLATLMNDKVGTRVVECYAATGDPDAWNLVKEAVLAAMRRSDGFIPAYAVNSLTDGCKSGETFSELWKSVFAPDDDTLANWVGFRANEALEKGRAVPVEQEPTKDAAGKGGADSKAPNPLVHFVESIAPSDKGLDASLDAAAAPDAVKQKLQKREETVTDIEADFRRSVLNDICLKALKHNKGQAYALLVEGVAGQSGTRLCEALFRYGRVAATPVVRSVAKISTTDLPGIAFSAGGSKALQRYVDCVAAESAAKCPAEPADAAQPAVTTELVPLSGGALRLWRKEKIAEQKKLGLTGKLGPPPMVQKQVAKDAKKPPVLIPEASPLLRLARRLAESVPMMCQSRYGSFLVQHMYAQGAIDVRTCLCQAMADRYAELKQHFLARVVLVHCHVEQFLYRNEEWKAQMVRQARVKKVMAAVVAAEEAYEHRAAPRPAAAADDDNNEDQPVAKEAPRKRTSTDDAKQLPGKTRNKPDHARKGPKGPGAGKQQQARPQGHKK